MNLLVGAYNGVRCKTIRLSPFLQRRRFEMAENILVSLFVALPIVALTVLAIAILQYYRRTEGERA